MNPRGEAQIALREMMGLPADVLIPESEGIQTPEQAARSEGRTARFRLDVVPAYNYTCALTGYHLNYDEAGRMTNVEEGYFWKTKDELRV